MPTAPPWAQVKLRVNHGEIPDIGVELRTPSGRRYQVINVRGKTLHCIVLPPEASVDGPVIEWTWTARNKRVEP